MNDLKKGDRVKFTHEFKGYAEGNRFEHIGEGVFQGWFNKVNHTISDITAPEIVASVSPDTGGSIWVLPADLNKT